MTGLPQRCCANCVSWSNTEPPLASGIRKPAGSVTDVGICRFNPPVLMPGEGARFPEIHASRICDDWMRDERGDGPDGGDKVVQFRRKAA